MFRRTWTLGIVLACLALFALAPTAHAGLIQDVAAIKVDLAYLQGRVDQLESNYGHLFTPEIQVEIDNVQADLQAAQNGLEAVMAAL